MNTVAVAVTASLGLLIAGCALDSKTADDNGGAAARQEHAERIPPAGADAAGVAPGMPSSDAVVEVPQGAGGTGIPAATIPPPGNGAADAGVRDAKEAAEEAARKIFGAAVGAATKIREVGLGAVQAVREPNHGDERTPGDSDG